MANWKIQKISEIADVKGGKRLAKGDVVTSTPSCHPYIRVVDMNGGKIDPRNVMYISEEVHKKVARYVISKEDIFISIAGTIGVICRVPEALDGANLTENAAKITLTSTEVTKDYLYYYLNSHEGQGQIRQRIGGASQPKLALDRVKSIEVRHPDISEQIRICSILNSYAEVINHLGEKIKILEEIADNRFQMLLHQPSGSDTKRSASLAEIADSINEKYEDKKHSSLPLIDLASINSKNLAVESIKNSNELQSSRIIFAGGDILFGSIRCYLHKVALAPFPGITNVSVFVVRPKKTIYSSFITALLFSSSTIDWASRNSNGTKMPTINWEVLSSMEISIPSDADLHKFNSFADTIYSEIQILTLMRLNLISQQQEKSTVLLARDKN